MGNQISDQTSGGVPPPSVPEQKQQTSNATESQNELISKLELRAMEAERTLELLEKRVESLSSVGDESGLAARYVAELKGLRGTLVEAQREHEALVENVATLETANAKLKYQILHLKRSLQSS